MIRYLLSLENPPRFNRPNGQFASRDRSRKDFAAHARPDDEHIRPLLLFLVWKIRHPPRIADREIGVLVQQVRTTETGGKPIFVLETLPRIAREIMPPRGILDHRVARPFAEALVLPPETRDRRRIDAVGRTDRGNIFRAIRPAAYEADDDRIRMQFPF